MKSPFMTRMCGTAKSCIYLPVKKIAIQSYCSRLSVGLLSHDSRLTLIWLNHRKKSGRVVKCAVYIWKSLPFSGTAPFNTAIFIELGPENISMVYVTWAMVHSWLCLFHIAALQVKPVVSIQIRKHLREDLYIGQKRFHWQFVSMASATWIVNKITF